jgi:hypothetical protein
MKGAFPGLCLAALGLALSGCQTTAEQPAMTIPSLGFRMEIPRGWQVGKPDLSGRHAYTARRGGTRCFRSRERPYPFGRVLVLPYPDYCRSLEEYVRLPGGLEGQLLSITPNTVCGLEGLMTLGAGLGEKGVPVEGIHQYIHKGDSLIVVSFLTTEDRFEEEEPKFRQALSTIRVDSE